MRPIGCLLCLIIFTIARACAREHSISKHKTWFWEPFNPDLSGATIFDSHGDHITATNVYFHTNRFYSLIEATNTSDTTADQKFHQSKKFAHNSAITPLPLTNIPNFLSNIKSGWISGTTLLIPFPEVDSPHHMGYWIEVLAPVYSYLNFDKNNNSNSSTIRTVLIPNLSRGTVMSSSWVMDMIKIATTTTTATSSKSAMKSDKEEKIETPPPRILFWDDLENTPLDSWLGFERILHVYTRYTNLNGKTRSNGASKATTTPTGKRERSFSFGFSSSEIAEKFRLAVHEATGIPPPVPGAPLPRTITYLMPTDSSGVTNNKHVLDALHRSAATSTTAVDSDNIKINNSKLAVRPYSPTPSVPLASLVAVMSRTGLLIGRHAPILANAAFLPPGAAVVEILPFNWNSGGRSEIYKNLTASRSTSSASTINITTTNESKSIVHVAWRAPSGDWMRYESEEDSRYSSWTPVECSSEHCIDAHARAGVEVNVEEFKKIVDDVIEVIYNSNSSNSSGGSRGEGFEESRLRQKLMEKYPWPRRVDMSGTSGLWWDRG